MVLPLISNVLPQSAVPNSNASMSSQALLLATLKNSAAAASQQLSVAVSATGASTEYAPYTPQQRQSQTGGKSSVDGKQPPASILPDPDIWKPEANTQPAVPAAPAAARAAQPINLPQLSQFTAQLMAQQSTQSVREENFDEPVFIRRPPTTKKQGVSDAKGADAYAVALVRNRGIIFPATIEEAI